MRYKPSATQRPTVLPPLSCRTIQHPSVPPYDLINFSSFQIHLHGGNQTEELVYSNPTMGSEMGIWDTQPENCRVFSCPQLNTPQPIMSACEAPPNQPDPFRCGPHPTRDLGSPSWRIQGRRPQAQPRRAVIQLTAEEDQAVTNLLKLHHQEAAETTVPSAHLYPSGPAESSPGCSAPSSVRVDAQYPERRRWAEAALRRGFNSVRTPSKTAGLEGPPQNPGTLPVWSKKDKCKNTVPLGPVNLKKRRRLEELTDSEEDAVLVLLSLSEAVVL